MNSPGATSPIGGRTVLVVEDNEIYRQVVCASLAKQLPGCEILGAGSIAEAGAIIGSRKLDVVITDLSLPDGSGVDLIPLLATDLAHGLKLVALTNDAAREVLPGLTARGYHGFVAKEHGIKALVQAVQTVLGGGTFISQPATE